MDIDSYLPYEGKVVLHNKQAKEAFVRIPLWVDREKTECSVNGDPIAKRWFGNYLRVESLRPEDEVRIEFPMEERFELWTKPEHGQHLITAIPGGTVFRFKFRGNTLVEVSPPLMNGSPLYRDRPKKYSAEMTPRRNVTRYVSSMILQW